MTIVSRTPAPRHQLTLPPASTHIRSSPSVTPFPDLVTSPSRDGYSLSSEGSSWSSCLNHNHLTVLLSVFAPPRSGPAPLQPRPPHRSRLPVQPVAPIRSVSSDFALIAQCPDLHHPHPRVSDSPQMSVICPQSKRHLYDNQRCQAIFIANVTFNVMSDIFAVNSENPSKLTLWSVVHTRDDPRLLALFSGPIIGPPHDRFLASSLSDLPRLPLKAHPPYECRSTKSGLPEHQPHSPDHPGFLLPACESACPLPFACFHRFISKRNEAFRNASGKSSLFAVDSSAICLTRTEINPTFSLTGVWLWD